MKLKFVDIKKLLRMCGKYDITFLGIFGSYARGNFTAGSDLDLLARFSRKKSLLDLVRTEREISEALGIKVDLLTEKSISPYLKEKILNNLEVLYDSKR